MCVWGGVGGEVGKGRRRPTEGGSNGEGERRAVDWEGVWGKRRGEMGWGVDGGGATLGGEEGRRLGRRLGLRGRRRVDSLGAGERGSG